MVARANQPLPTPPAAPPPWESVLLKICEHCYNLEGFSGSPVEVDGTLYPAVLDPRASFFVGTIVGKLVYAGILTQPETALVLEALDRRGAEWVLEYLAEQERHK